DQCVLCLAEHYKRGDRAAEPLIRVASRGADIDLRISSRDIGRNSNVDVLNSGDARRGDGVIRRQDVVARYVSRDAAASRRNESGCKDLDHAARLLRLGSAIQRTILIQDTVGKNRRADDSELDGLRRTRPSVRGYD